MQIKSAKDLIVYRKAYELAIQIFYASKGFPKEEQYSLIDQIRRSSRSVCSNLREKWTKRRYEAHFVSKLTDADGDNAETETWLDFGCDSGYNSKADHGQFIEIPRNRSNACRHDQILLPSSSGSQSDL